MVFYRNKIVFKKSFQTLELISKADLSSFQEVISAPKNRLLISGQGQLGFSDSRIQNNIFEIPFIFRDIEHHFGPIIRFSIQVGGNINSMVLLTQCVTPTRYVLTSNLKPISRLITKNIIFYATEAIVLVIFLLQNQHTSLMLLFQKISNNR